MRRAAQVALCLALLTGCGITRRSMKSDTETNSEATAAVHAELESNVKEETTTQTEQSRDEEVVTVVVEYDTARPADSTTGTHPVRRTIRQTRRATASARQDARTDTRATATATADAAAEESVQRTFRAEQESRRGMNGLQQMLCYAGAAAILGLVLRLARWRLKQR